jgi:wingless-type MMTV integration site family protein 4
MTQMQLVCKCHGVSGSCSMKICWRVMPSFREVGRDLKTRFDGASHVMYLQQRHRLKPYDAKQKKPTKRDLVYLEESPDFCEYNPNTGSLGTKGRECNKSSYGLDGCALMCCGRGYQTIIKETKEDCDCKFFWCCHVECRKCTRTVEKHYCK